nr:hypothetical protein [Tanacetum cinerariifolium]
MVLGYKSGLESIEERLKFFKTNESVYLEDIKLLKVKIQIKDIAITELRRKLDLAQKEKDSIQLTVDKLENASKSINKLIDCQIVDNYKKRLGYENYNAVPPPCTRNFIPPKPDLSFTGLDEFANKLVVENCDIWNTAKANSINRGAHIHVKVDGKKVIISEASIRRDLQFADEEGIDCLPNDTIFEQLSLMRLARAATTASSLEAERDSGNINKTQSKATPNESSSQGTDSGGGPRCQDTMGDTIAQTRVLNLEKRKTTQALEIDSLKRRVKKLEKKQRSRTYKLKRLYKVDDEQIFDVNDLHGEEVFVQKDVASEVNTASIETTDSAAAIMNVDEVTLAQALIEIKSTKPKAKGIVLQEPSKSRTTIISLKKSQDKGKVIIIEEPVKLKKKDQIMLDQEVALKLQAELQAEFDKEQRLARWKPNSLKNKSFANIQEFFDKAMKRVNTFVDYRTELEQESSKKQKIDDDKETAELKQLVKIIPDEEGVAIDAIPLAVKPPSIVDWKIHKEEKKSYYKIIRADGSLKIYLVFSHMLKSFNREDVETLWKLVKAKHRSTRPEGDYERVLWGDLKVMFEQHIKDEVWKMQQRHDFAKSINGEAQIHAKVGEKKVIISEASIRIDLQFADEGGIDCLPNDTIFKQLALTGIVVTSIRPNPRQHLMSQASKGLIQVVVKCHDTMRDTIAQTRSERVSKLSNDLLLARALEINSLKRRIKKLEKKKRSINHKLKRLYKGRKINDINADEDITLVNDQDDEQMFDVNDLQGGEVFVQEYVAGDVNAASIATTDNAATTMTIDEVTLAQALMEIKSKAIMIEEPVKLKKKRSIMLYQEVALKLQAELQAKFDEEQRLVKEQQELNDAEKATLFMQLLEKRRKFFASKRAEEKRIRPPIRAQQRSIMCTYLKNMEGWKPNSLKNKSFANIQELFDKVLKRVNTFVYYITKLVEESSKKAEAEVIEGSSKRASTELQQENEEGVAIDAIPLAVKPPSIVDWKIHKEKLVKVKHGSTRPEEDYERVLWGDLKFWTIAKAKSINREAQIHAKHTPTILQPSTSQHQKTQKHRNPRRKVTEVPQPSDPMEHVVDEAVYKELDDRLVKDIKEKDKIRAKTRQNQEQTRSMEKSKVNPDKVKAQSKPKSIK